MITVQIPDLGTYVSDGDLFDRAVQRPTADLQTEVLERADLSAARVGRLLHCELAGMAAEWETGARQNERDAAQVAAETEAVRQRRTDAEIRNSSPATVVMNVSDLKPAMRRALLDGHATLNTARALCTRGLVEVIGTLAHGGRYPLNLTEAGRRATEALRAESVPVDPMAVDEALVAAPYREEGSHAYAYGFLASSVQSFLTSHRSPAQLRADLAHTARALIGDRPADPGSSLARWAGVSE